MALINPTCPPADFKYLDPYSTDMITRLAEGDRTSFQEELRRVVYEGLDAIEARKLDERLREHVDD